MDLTRRGFLKALGYVPVGIAAASLPSIAFPKQGIAAPAVAEVAPKVLDSFHVDVSYRIDRMAWQLYAERDGYYIAELYDDMDWQRNKDGILKKFREIAEIKFKKVS